MAKVPFATADEMVDEAEAAWEDARKAKRNLKPSRGVPYSIMVRGFDCPSILLKSSSFPRSAAVPAKCEGKSGTKHDPGLPIVTVLRSGLTRKLPISTSIWLSSRITLFFTQ